MARYRVAKPMLWILGGEPERNDRGGIVGWLGGEAVTLEPGALVEIADEELPGAARYLATSTSRHGRELLAACRAAKVGARRVAVADIPPRAAAVLQLHADDWKRRHGRGEELLDELEETMKRLRKSYARSRSARDAAIKGAEERAQSAQERRDRIERAALGAIAQLQRNGQEPASRNALARSVSKALDETYETVRGILQELGIPKPRRPRR